MSVDCSVSVVVAAFWVLGVSGVSFPAHAISENAMQRVRIERMVFLVFMIKYSFT